MKSRLPSCYLLFLVGFVALAVGRLLAGDPPPQPPISPPVSQFAPAADLVAQVKLTIDGLSARMATDEAYQADVENLERDAHTLAALALVLGMHDSDHPLKAAAPALVAASRALAKAGDYATAQKAVEAVEKAAANDDAKAEGELKWEKVAGLGRLMEQVAATNTRLKRGIERFDPRRKDQNARDAAVLAAIAQMAVYDTHEVKRAEDLDEWYRFCGQMRDAAGELNAKIKAADKEGAGVSMAKLAQSCDACHEVFAPDQK